MKFLCNGADVIEKIKPSAILMYDRAGGEADSLTAIFPNGSQWAAWNPKREDKVQFIDGDFDSGILYIDDIQISYDGCRLEAVSVPPSARKPRTKIWRDIKLSGIISDCASRAGLGFETYGTTDYTYKAITQFNESDFAFLQRICTREGYAVKISGGKLIVFSEKYMENISASITITQKDVNPNYKFANGTGLLNSVSISHYNVKNGENYAFTAIDTTVLGGEKQINTLCVSQGEAERFTYGYLRAVNKWRKIGQITLAKQTALAAGSVINLTGFDGEQNGNWFVYGVKQDGTKTVLYIRKPLAY